MTRAARTDSVDATRELAAVVARHAAAGDVILLAGELGAGKTAFVQGFGAALGVDQPITSPTFTLAHQYEGKLVLHHLDVYRLERLAQLADIAVSTLPAGGGVVLLEWGDAVSPALPNDSLHRPLSYVDGHDERPQRHPSVGGRRSP